jgi:hypothetical protein
MGFVAAKCTECGSPLQIDAAKDAGICPFCGAAFVVEKAINNFITDVRNDIKVENAVFNVGGYDIEQEKVRFDTLIRIGDWLNAHGVAGKMYKEKPESCLSYMCELIAYTKNLTSFFPYYYDDPGLKYNRKARDLGVLRDMYKAAYNNFLRAAASAEREKFAAFITGAEKYFAELDEAAASHRSARALRAEAKRKRAVEKKNRG